MTFTDREAIVRQISDELSLAPTEVVQQRALTAWRAKLEKEPISLPSFRIDQIIREARKRLIVTSQSSAPPRKMEISHPVTTDQPSWSNGIWPTF
jgi:hypothetical protein